MIIVYVMLTMSTSLMGHDMMQVLVSMMTTGYWFATPQNRWEQMLDGTTPSWLVISDQRHPLRLLERQHHPLPAGRAARPGPTPSSGGSASSSVLVFVLICLSVLFRPLWSDRERLTFPIIQLPLELTEPHDPPASATRCCGSASGWAPASASLNGLTAIFPAVPSVPLYIDLQDYITN